MGLSKDKSGRTIRIVRPKVLAENSGANGKLQPCPNA
jgi:hypothetical protein